MMYYIEIVAKTLNLPAKLYHGTNSTFLKLIEKAGLQPTKDRHLVEMTRFMPKQQRVDILNRAKPMIQFTQNLREANKFADESAQIYGGEPVVLVFVATKADIDLYSIKVGDSSTWALAYKNIPWNRLKVVK